MMSTGYDACAEMGLIGGLRFCSSVGLIWEHDKQFLM